MDNARFEKIEKQLELLMLKVDIIYHKIVQDESITSQKKGVCSEDDLFNEAKIVVVKTGEASASILQRKLRIGYARAAQLLDLMEDKGIVGPSQGAKSRKILIKK